MNVTEWGHSSHFIGKTKIPGLLIKVVRMGRENRKWPENNQVWRRNGYAFGASISEFLASLSKISCLSNVMLMAHNCSPRYLLYGLCFLSKDWMWDLCRKPCTHLQDDCLRSGHGLWPWNGAKPIRPYVDQACDLDLISTVVGSARLTSPRWLSLMLYFVYKDPKAHSGQSKCLNWALFNVWFDANKLGVFSFFLEFFGRMASFTLDLLKSNTSFELCPLLSLVMREAIKCHILTSLVLASLTSHCGGSKVLPRGH